MWYLGIAAVLAVWAFFALRDRPLRQYGQIYAMTSALGCAAECSVLGTVYPFETHMFVFPDPYRDLFLTEILVKLFLFPLIGCLYVRYAGKHPVRTGAIGVALLGLLELLLVSQGAMLYFRWNTLFSMALFVGLFAILHWLSRMEMPRWLDIGAAAFVVAYITSQMALVAKLYKYVLPVPQYTTDAALLLLKNGLLVGPSVLAIALIPRLRTPVGILAVVAGNVLADEWLRWNGIMIYSGWNVWLGGLRYLLIIGVTLAYANWQMEAPRKPILST